MFVNVFKNLSYLTNGPTNEPVHLKNCAATLAKLVLSFIISKDIMWTNKNS